MYRLGLMLFVGGCTVVFVDEPPQPAETDADSKAGTKDTSTTTHYKMLSVGAKHLCALDGDKQVKCWGDDEKAVSVPALDFTYVTAGPGYSCGVTNEKVECWGSESPGSPDHSDGIASVHGASGFACALSTGKEVTCWGPEAEAPTVKYAESIDAGGKHACAITRSDPDNGFQANQWACWGAEATNQFPSDENLAFKALDVAKDHTCAISDSPATLCLPENVQTKEEFVSIAAAPNFACGLNMKKKIKCWGVDNSDAPQVPEDEWVYVAASATEDWACGIAVDQASDNRKIKCWGSALPNQLP